MIVKSKEEAIMEHNKLVIEIKSRIEHILKDYEYLDKNVVVAELLELSYIADFYVEERRRISDSRTFERRIEMEQLLSMLKELQMRNEALARELGGTQAERDFWRNKYLEEQPAKEVKPF